MATPSLCDCCVPPAQGIVDLQTFTSGFLPLNTPLQGFGGNQPIIQGATMYRKQKIEYSSGGGAFSTETEVVPFNGFESNTISSNTPAPADFDTANFRRVISRSEAVAVLELDFIFLNPGRSFIGTATYTLSLPHAGILPLASYLSARINDPDSAFPVPPSQAIGRTLNSSGTLTQSSSSITLESKSAFLIVQGYLTGSPMQQRTPVATVFYPQFYTYGQTFVLRCRKSRYLLGRGQAKVSDVVSGGSQGTFGQMYGFAHVSNIACEPNQPEVSSVLLPPPSILESEIKPNFGGRLILYHPYDTNLGATTGYPIELATPTGWPPCYNPFA